MSRARRSFGLHRYAPVLRRPGAARVALGTFLSRAGQFGGGLTMLLAVHAATGSFGLAGTATGIMTATAAPGRIVQGRLVDRGNPARVLSAFAGVHLLVLVALAAAADRHASAPPLLALAALGGFSMPSVASVMRSLWATLLPDPEQRTPAYALDAMISELAAMGGPALGGVLATALTPAPALVATAALTSGGALLMATCHLVREPVRTLEDVGESELPFARLMALPVAVALGIGLMAGAIEVAVPAFATTRHHAGASGALLALWAAGSLLGGLWYGTRHWRIRHELRLLWGLTAMSATCTLLPLAGSTAALGLLLVLCGLPIAPSLTTLSLVIDARVPPERIGEAFAWITSALPAGAALGSVLAGWIVAGATIPLAFALAAATSLLALSAGALAARRVLAPAAAAA